jgi:TatD DNase family protein
MIDTHCHLTYDGLRERVEDVIAAACAAGVDRMISVGTGPSDARRAIELAERFEGVYATVGLHPHYCASVPEVAGARAAMREVLDHPKVVAVGEMGLDLHYPDPPLALQQQWLELQLTDLAPAGKPIIIHNREATAQTLAVLRASGIPGERFVFHCFTGSAAELDAILAFGAMISFTGIVTFRGARDLAVASDAVPLDRLMIETDSPYLTPEPHRKVRPNEPRYVRHVAAFLADRRGMPLETFVARVDANADRFFRLRRGE